MLKTVWFGWEEKVAVLCSMGEGKQKGKEGPLWYCLVLVVVTAG